MSDRFNRLLALVIENLDWNLVRSLVPLTLEPVHEPALLRVDELDGRDLGAIKVLSHLIDAAFDFFDEGCVLSHDMPVFPAILDSFWLGLVSLTSLLEAGQLT